MGETRRQPRILIGSSWESRALADALRDTLLYTAEVTVRHQGFYPLSSDATDSLLHDLSAADFVVFLLGVEDVALMRDECLTVTRDNLLLQLGIALGTVGRSRVFFVSPRNLPRDAPEFHIPAEALGVITGTFSLNHRHDDLASTLSVVCAEIRREVTHQGTRSPERAPAANAPVTPAAPVSSVPVTPLSRETPAPSARPRIRIRFDQTEKGPETSQEEQCLSLKGWWDTLSERERRTIIRFGEIDQRLNLRRGMTKSHLREVAEADGYCVDHEGESLIIFHPVAPPELPHGPAAVRDTLEEENQNGFIGEGEKQAG